MILGAARRGMARPGRAREGAFAPSRYIDMKVDRKPEIEWN